MRVVRNAALAIMMLAATTVSSGWGAPAAPAARDTVKRSKAGEGWPDTRAGVLGRGWVEAFDTSAEAMKEFNRKELSQEALTKRSLEVRTESYLKLRDQYGILTLAKVIQSTPGELTVSLLDSDAALHEFIFAVQTEAPFKLISVSIRQNRSGHGGGFHH